MPKLKIRRSCDRLIFNMGIPILWKDGLYIETGPRYKFHSQHWPWLPVGQWLHRFQMQDGLLLAARLPMIGGSWPVFSPWASPYGANGRINMMLHKYICKIWTLNGENLSSVFSDMNSSKSGSKRYQIWQFFSPWLSSYGANGQMTMILHNFRSRQFVKTSNGINPSSGFRDMCSSKSWTSRLPVHLPEAVHRYPSSLDSWGV